MEDELAAVAANGENDGMDWPISAQHAPSDRARGPDPSLDLQDLTGDDFALIDWADAPSFTTRLSSRAGTTHATCSQEAMISLVRRKNCVYFFNWQHLEEGKDAEYCLCKMGLASNVSPPS
jgi:hypothetical protein